MIMALLYTLKIQKLSLQTNFLTENVFSTVKSRLFKYYYYYTGKMVLLQEVNGLLFDHFFTVKKF